MGESRTHYKIALALSRFHRGNYCDLFSMRAFVFHRRTPLSLRSNARQNKDKGKGEKEKANKAKKLKSFILLPLTLHV